MEEIPGAILSKEIDGINLSSNKFADEIKDKTVLLVLLRYKGCIFCPQMVKDLKNIAENNSNYPEIIFIFQGNAEQGKSFFNKYWPKAKAIADPQREFYSDLKIQKATIGQMFGQKVWMKGLEAIMHGNFVGIPIGDLRMMPGLFLLQDNKIVWKHNFEHIADHPDFCKMPFTVDNL
ncbi:MAG: SelL-related redox protein [Candidatus Caenarcaniphilales bacterium]|nr:SelL-related redox protein [Candidatus Caenarcaniphilales bacterium]